MPGTTVDKAVNETDQNLNPLWNEASNGGGQDKDNKQIKYFKHIVDDMEIKIATENLKYIYLVSIVKVK